MPRPLKKAQARGADSPGQVTTTIRMPADLRAQLEQAAAEQTRNLSQEMERRLRRSFSYKLLAEDLLDAAVLSGGADVRGSFAHWLALQTLQRLYGDHGGHGVFLARSLKLIDVFEEDAPGAKLRITRSQLDRLKAAIREIERNSIIIKEGEKED